MQSQTVPAPRAPAVIFELPSILERIDPASLFPAAGPLEIELGSGDGSFLVNWAAISTQTNFIAVERLLGRIRKLERKARRAGLSNVRAVRIESAYFLEYLVPAHRSTALHIYFPDPWPKRKHERHRLINERFPLLAKQALAPAGKVHLRTDDPNYFEQMTRVFEASPFFSATETPARLSGIKTDFEREFEAQGKHTLLASYERKHA